MQGLWGSCSPCRSQTLAAGMTDKAGNEVRMVIIRGRHRPIQRGFSEEVTLTWQWGWVASKRSRGCMGLGSQGPAVDNGPREGCPR